MKVMLAALAVIIASLLLVADAHGATLTESTTWRQTWTTYNFPGTSGTDTPQFVTRYLQLPSTVQAGDLVIVAGREEFTNPTWGSLGGWLVNGVLSEHWSTPYMGACGLKKLQGAYNPDQVAWSWISQQVAENWTGEQHHWVYDETEMFVASAGDASAYVGVVCYFSRSVSYRDPDSDWIVAHPTYGKVEAAVLR